MEKEKHKQQDEKAGWNRRKFLKIMPLAMTAPYLLRRSSAAAAAALPGSGLNFADKPITPEKLLETVPQPVLPSRPDLVKMYEKCWLIGLAKSQHGTPENGFVDWYIDAAFDSRIFQWDTSFSIAWAKYSQGGLPSITSQDNFYRKQHADGAIGGVIKKKDGSDNQPTDSPSFTHNNLFSWAEWEYYQVTGDSSRFERVVPILKKYANWVAKHRRHKNGHYYWSGFGSGMDNSPRSKARAFYPPYGWVDYDGNEALAAYYLVKMAEVIGDEKTAKEFRALHREIKEIVNRDMWSEEDRFYWDIDRDGSFMKVKTIASFWPMWGRITEEKHVEGLVRHLNDAKSFNRPHRVPTTAADEPTYVPSGGYWRGSIWAPTNHMVVLGLMANNRLKLAREIVQNHLNNMSVIFKESETVWENYSPEFAKPGAPAKSDFVGWSADGPIAQLIESYIGINVDVPQNRIVWNLLTTEEVGLRNLKFGDSTIELIAGERKLLSDPVELKIKTGREFDLILNNGENSVKKKIPIGTNSIKI